MPMNNKLRFIGWALVAILVLFGVYQIFTPSGNERGVENIAIGASLPLTGGAASFGERLKNGMEIAVEDLETVNNIDLNVIYEDDKGEAPTAVTVVNKLINTDGVKIIVGSAKSDALLAMAPVTEAQKVILFSPTAGADKISEAGDYVFRNIELADAHGKGATDFLVSQNKRNVALFVAQASNAQTYGTVFKKNFVSVGNNDSGNNSTNDNKIVFELSYNPANSDFRTDIAKALNAKPEAFYLAVSAAKDAGILVKQIREQNFKGIIVASIAAEAKEFFDTAGNAAEGTFVTSASFDIGAQNVKSFAARYKNKFGVDPDWVSANAYDATTLLATAALSCGSDQDTECIRDYLYATKNYSGIGGNLSFDQNGDVVKPVMIKVARGGLFVKF